MSDERRIINCDDCGKEVDKWAECFWCKKKVCVTCFLDSRHDHEDEAGPWKPSTDAAESGKG